MKLLLIHGIPHWIDGDVALPVMAGGQTLDRILELRRSGQLPTPTGPDEFADLFAFYGIDPNSSAANVVRSRIAAGEPANDVFLEIAALSQTGPFAPTGGGGAGRAPPAFSSTQAAQDQAEAFRSEQDRLSREFQANQDRISLEARAEENRLAEEAALKRNRLSTLTDLIQSFVASQAQARDTLANLPADDFRFAAVAGGVAPFGVTPQQGFQQQLTNIASAPVPTADPNASLPSIESAIQGLTGANVPLSPQVFGAAGGATIPAPPPGQSVNVKVGEKGEEILRITAQGVEVIPITTGAQEGGFFPFQPIEFDRSSLFPALAPLLSEGGIRPFDVPKPGAPGINIGLRGTSTSPTQALQQFGIRPALFRLPGGQVFARIGDEIRGVPNPEILGQLGINIDDLVNLPGVEQLRQFGTIGSNIQSSEVRGILEAQALTPTASPFGKFSQPIIEPTTGTLLPAPFTVATELNRLRLVNPTAFNLLLSAYSAAGVPAAAVLSTVQQSLIFGQERGTIGLN